MTDFSPADAVEDLACHPDAFDELRRADANTIVSRLVTDALEPAMRQIMSLAATASNERLRFDASKYIIELGRPVGGEGDPESPIEKLIAEIQTETENDRPITGNGTPSKSSKPPTDYRI